MDSLGENMAILRSSSRPYLAGRRSAADCPKSRSNLSMRPTGEAVSRSSVMERTRRSKPSPVIWISRRRRDPGRSLVLTLWVYGILPRAPLKKAKKLGHESSFFYLFHEGSGLSVGTRAGGLSLFLQSRERGAGRG